MTKTGELNSWLVVSLEASEQASDSSGAKKVQVYSLAGWSRLSMIGKPAGELIIKFRKQEVRIYFFSKLLFFLSAKANRQEES